MPGSGCWHSCLGNRCNLDQAIGNPGHTGHGGLFLWRVALLASRTLYTGGGICPMGSRVPIVLESLGATCLAIFFE